MKFKTLISFIVVMAFFSFKPAEASAKKIKIDTYITDVNGVRHHVHGWVDFNIFKMKIEHCDIWYDNTHFVMSEDSSLQIGSPTNDYIDGAMPMNENLLMSLFDGTYSETDNGGTKTFLP